jgi:iron(III) transport system permease protein
MSPARERDYVSDWRRYMHNITGYGTIVITMLMIGVFLVYPISRVMIRAFYDGQNLTFIYFKLLFENQLMMESLRNSIFLAGMTTLGSTLLALPLAIIGNRYKFYGKTVLMALLLVPMVMPPFVGAIGLQRFFARYGTVNLMLINNKLIREPIDWFAEDHKLWAVIILGILHLYPIMYLNLSAALANIDPSLEEMAATLGIPRWRKFKDITWPLARPGYVAGATIVFIWSLTDLGTPLLFGLHQVISVKIFDLVTDINENPAGFALVFLMLAVTIGFFLLSKLLASGRKFEMMSRGHVTNMTRKPRQIVLIGIYLILAIVIGLSLLPHVSVLITSLSKDWFMTALPEQYTLEHYKKIFAQELPTTGLKNSLMLASLATMVDAILGSLVAYVIARRLIPLTGLLDAVVMIPLALPGIILAFSYVVAFSRTILDPMTGPWTLLIMAYAVRRLPFMVRSAMAGLQQTNVSLEEASATFGASRFYTLRKITMPLILANVIAGSLICFAYAMLDVSDGMILALKDRYYPLTKVIYALYLEQANGEFVASALGIISMLILTICILVASVLLGRRMGELFRA